MFSAWGAVEGGGGGFRELKVIEALGGLVQVQGSGFRVQGLGLKVWGLYRRELRASEYRVSTSGEGFHVLSV